MSIRLKYGSTALICGGSEGIGAAFAEYLAERGINLVIVARRTDILNKFVSQVQEKYKVKVSAIACDLSDDNADRFILGNLNGADVDILVYNAAISFIGPFQSRSEDDYLRASMVNMITPLKLVYSLAAKMKERGRGAIILMSSMAGLQGSGYLAFYASTKAYNRILAESLWYEWKDSGVDIIACVAGATSTPGYYHSDPVKTSMLAPRVLRPGEIPPECFRFIGKKPSFIAGRGNRVASFFMTRLLPHKMVVKIMGSNTRKMYRL